MKEMWILCLLFGFILCATERKVGPVPGIKLSFPTEKGPILYFQRGYQNRVEFIRADLRPEYLDTGSDTTKMTRKYADDMGKVSDDAGHLIANRLGGTGKKTYNIIPQNPNINRGKWKTIENEVYQEVKNKKKIRFSINPIYASKTATRPSYLAYEIKVGKGDKFESLSSGTIENPL